MIEQNPVTVFVIAIPPHDYELNLAASQWIYCAQDEMTLQRTLKTLFFKALDAGKG